MHIPKSAYVLTEQRRLPHPHAYDPTTYPDLTLFYILVNLGCGVIGLGGFRRLSNRYVLEVVFCVSLCVSA